MSLHLLVLKVMLPMYEAKQSVWNKLNDASLIESPYLSITKEIYSKAISYLINSFVPQTLLG